MAPSSKGKEKVIGDGSSDKRKRGVNHDDMTGGGKRRNRGVVQFFDEAAGDDDSEDDSDDMFIDDDADFLDDEFDTGVSFEKGASRPPIIRVKEEQQTEEEFDKHMEERYKKGSGFVAFEEDNYESKKSMFTDEFWNPVKEPVVWKVKCVAGRERHSVFCLMQKYVDMKYFGNALHTISAFSVDHIKGFIYIEADKQQDIYEACNGLSSIYSTRMAPVRKDDILRLFTVRSIGASIKEGMWARVKMGKYKGDLAQVAAINNASKKVTIKLVPRIDMKALAEKFARGTSRTTASRAVIPAPRLISSSELEEFRPLIQYRRDRDTNKTFEVLDGMLLKDGYLFKKVSFDSLSFWGATPTEDELLKFEPSNVDESKDLEFLAQLYGEEKKKGPVVCGKGGGKGDGASSSSADSNFEVGDLVFFGRKDFGVIIGSEKDGTFKIIKPGSEGAVVATLQQRDLKNASFDKKLFSILDHQSKTISINDTVRVVEGPLKDREGTVKRIYRGIVFLYNETVEENSGYFCIKAQMCEKVEVAVELHHEKGGEPGPSEFSDFPSSPKSPLSPKESGQGRDGIRNFKREDDSMFSVGQQLRIRVGPLKGYLCRVLAVRRTDVTVKLDSKHKVITVKCEHVVEVRGRNSGISLGEDSGVVKPFDLLTTQDGSSDWMAGASKEADGGSWNAGGSAVERNQGGDSWGRAAGGVNIKDDSGNSVWNASGVSSPLPTAGWGGTGGSADAPEDTPWNKGKTPVDGQPDSWGSKKKEGEGAEESAWNHNAGVAAKQDGGSSWGKPEAGSANQDGGSAWGKPEAGSAKQDWGSTRGKPEAGSAKQDEGSSWGKAAGSAKQDMGSSWGKPEAGSAEPNGGSSWGKPEAGSTKQDGGSSWGKPELGSAKQDGGGGGGGWEKKEIPAETNRIDVGVENAGAWNKKASDGGSASGWGQTSKMDVEVEKAGAWDKKTSDGGSSSGWGKTSKMDVEVEKIGIWDKKTSKEGSSSGWGQSSKMEVENVGTWDKKTINGGSSSGWGQSSKVEVEGDKVGSWNNKKTSDGGSSAGWGQSKWGGAAEVGGNDSWSSKGNWKSDNNFSDKAEQNDSFDDRGAGGNWRGGRGGRWGQDRGGFRGRGGSEHGGFGDRGGSGRGDFGGSDGSDRGGFRGRGGFGGRGRGRRDDWNKNDSGEENGTDSWNNSSDKGGSWTGNSGGGSERREFRGRGGFGGRGRGRRDDWNKNDSGEENTSYGWKNASDNGGSWNSDGGGGSERGGFRGRGGFGGRGRGWRDDWNKNDSGEEKNVSYSWNNPSDNGGSWTGNKGGGSERGGFRGRGGFGGRGRGRWDDWNNKDSSEENANKGGSWNSNSSGGNWSSGAGNDKGKWQSGNSGWAATERAAAGSSDTQLGQWNKDSSEENANKGGSWNSNSSGGNWSSGAGNDKGKWQSGNSGWAASEGTAAGGSDTQVGKWNKDSIEENANKGGSWNSNSSGGNWSSGAGNDKGKWQSGNSGWAASEGAAAGGGDTQAGKWNKDSIEENANKGGGSWNSNSSGGNWSSGAGNDKGKWQSGNSGWAASEGAAAGSSDTQLGQWNKNSSEENANKGGSWNSNSSGGNWSSGAGNDKGKWQSGNSGWAASEGAVAGGSNTQDGQWNKDTGKSEASGSQGWATKNSGGNWQDAGSDWKSSEEPQGGDIEKVGGWGSGESKDDKGKGGW